MLLGGASIIENVLFVKVLADIGNWRWLTFRALIFFIFYWPQIRKEAGLVTAFTAAVAIPRFHPVKVHVISSYALQKCEEISVYLSSRFIFQSFFLGFESYFAGLSLRWGTCWVLNRLKSANKVVQKLWCGTGYDWIL